LQDNPGNMHAVAQCLAVLSLLTAATAFSPLSSLPLRARRPVAITGIRAQETSIGEVNPKPCNLNPKL